MKNFKNKVLLITSSFEDLLTDEGKMTEEWGEETYYPLGLAYIHSYLESKGMEVETLWLNHKPYENCFKEVIDKVKYFAPDVVGFQMLTCNRVSSYYLIEWIHKNYPKIKIVLGGIHSTIMYKQLIEKYPFSITVLGDGEITLFKLIKELNKKSPNLKKIDGIAFYKNNSVIRTKARKLIEDLDSLPFPKHEVFFNYSKRWTGSLLSTRGCPNACSFCCLNPESKRIVRFRDPKKVVDEIEYMINKFPQMKELSINDDSFFVNNQKVIDICNEIIKRKIKMDFVCSGRIKPISKEVVEKLEEANFIRVTLGIESGDDGILKSCHKGINQEDILKAFKLFSKSNIHLKTYLIIGLPGESIETIKETARFIRKLQKIKYVSYPTCFNILFVYPGTEVYEIAKSKGFIDDEFWLADKQIPLYTAENSYEKLKEFEKILADNLSFYRIMTPKGFKAQFETIPYLLKYGFQRIATLLKKGRLL
ncbi:MAG: radical SAM protein [Candidatus Diapherotrites archaeon]